MQRDDLRDEAAHQDDVIGDRRDSKTVNRESQEEETWVPTESLLCTKTLLDDDGETLNGNDGNFILAGDKVDNIPEYASLDVDTFESQQPIDDNEDNNNDELIGSCVGTERQYLDPGTNLRSYQE
ncbi:hypothetical protein SARC_08909 [Sphaeroforma arctica JP610]|uniref:Uncharacterized protein n=1 Tax=Sphaeroforma arctica JP610 TaxID=667725 RepID=A0A0L0FPE1_9EUKA|nr:hypothetical protein SARC_08909 [Sphaeroforma arctica JP610]KNC78672.1 hypothetical protein SARC_08909 [Sphaeroforma arctica JP610]|eukprot:XP_014152574.1 hypothetical protein SARC_08909 [Sphaeroforma arctica JP610]